MGNWSKIFDMGFPGLLYPNAHCVESIKLVNRNYVVKEALWVCYSAYTAEEQTRMRGDGLQMLPIGAGGQ